MRRDARRLRKALSAEASQQTAIAMTDHFMQGPLSDWSEPRLPVIAGYWPFGTEMDTKYLLTMLAEKGYQIALPFTDVVRPSLFFRKWEPGVAFVADAMGIKSPPATAPMLAPDIIIAAALAFDRTGHRLGYGTGYYDATLQSLRAVRKVIAVTVAFAAQEVETIDPEPQDQPVDWIVTERYALKIT